MFTRLRTGWLAGGTALLLMLALTGVALGADSALDGTTGDPVPAEETVDTIGTFEDLDGDGVDDDCQDAEAVADEEAVAAALAAADLNGDGVISVFEAAQTDWVGGKNCNHGGYVSGVAHGDDEACESETTEPEVGDAEDGEETGDAALLALEDEVVDETEDPTEACADEDEVVDEDEEDEAAETVCEAVPAPELPAEFTTVGAWVSLVARSDATGGKNCNHGGAVSAAAKAAQAARDLAREARAAERDAAKAERAAAKAERAAERAADKAARHGGHGKGNAKGKGKGHGKGG